MQIPVIDGREMRSHPGIGPIASTAEACKTNIATRVEAPVLHLLCATVLGLLYVEVKVESETHNQVGHDYRHEASRDWEMRPNGVLMGQLSDAKRRRLA